MSASDFGAKLQHPRRSLGNRHRSQANKFLKLAETDNANLGWAEQSARQAVLHDFTHPDNWRLLIKIKVLGEDATGIRTVLDELFLILGRDPELLAQLDGVDLTSSANKLLEGALSIDPLDPDAWWDRTQGESGVETFLKRVRGLDFTDPRANILFSRRMERLLENGYEDEYLELTRKLLAQRPSNHEAWARLGRLHERREEFDEAWFCYDQAQTHSASLRPRDEFRERMEARLDGGEVRPWKAPDIQDRVDFLTRMQSLAIPANSDETGEAAESEDSGAKESEFERAERLHASGRSSEAFFIARRLAAEGDGEALSLAQAIQEAMDDG